jgi:hypothetical protein
LGAINLVDYGPYNGNFEGTVVQGNTIDASSAMIRIAMAMGGWVWGCPDPDQDIVRGATVINNTLKGKHMGYGFIVDGVTHWKVMGNRSQALHSGEPGVGCDDIEAASPGPFIKNSARSRGKFQEEFREGPGGSALWPVSRKIP